MTSTGIGAADVTAQRTSARPSSARAGARAPGRELLGGGPLPRGRERARGLLAACAHRRDPPADRQRVVEGDLLVAVGGEQRTNAAVDALVGAGHAEQQLRACVLERR